MSESDGGQGRPENTRQGRRRVLKYLALFGGGIAAASVAGNSVWNALTSPEAKKQESTVVNVGKLDVLASNVVSGGPPKDGIPSIDRPQFVPAAEGDQFLGPEERVFGLVYRGEVKAYPQKILVWHEIVNDRVGGERLSVTYCPLTGSAVGFMGRTDDSRELTFGTTGNLVNSNLLMYDRQTDSEWPQVLGIAIRGPQKTKVLDEVPLVWTTWERWKEKHRDTLVLSRKTGYFRAYGSDPYGDYLDPQAPFNYYYNSSLYFPVTNTSERFHSKKVVIGVKAGGGYLAIPKDGLRQKQVLNSSVGSEPIVAIYDMTLDTARVFSRSLGGRTLTFRQVGGKIVDAETDSTWSQEGEAVAGSQNAGQLSIVRHFDVMWFAWAAFFPETQVHIP